MNFVERLDDITYWLNINVWSRGIQWRAPHAEPKADFISELWASDTIATLGLKRALMILASPNYPHTWRCGFGWWHRWNCAPCAEAKVKWPETRRRILSAFDPFKRDLPLIPNDEAEAWVKRELKKGEFLSFKPLEEINLRHGERRDCLAEKKPHHLCERSGQLCVGEHNGVRCCLCDVTFCRWVVDHDVYFEDWEK